MTDNVRNVCIRERWGIHKEMGYLETERVKLVYRLPLNEIILDSHDRLKSLPAAMRPWITSTLDTILQTSWRWTSS
jgi:translation elongation factor EF-4